MTKLSEFTNTMRSLANDLDKLLVSTTPETYQEALVSTLTKYGMQNDLDDLARG